MDIYEHNFNCMRIIRDIKTYRNFCLKYKYFKYNYRVGGLMDKLCGTIMINK